MSEATAKFDSLPKIELHCHLEGSVPSALAIELAQRNGVELPTRDPDALYDYERLGGFTLERFLAIYTAVSAAMQTPTDFADVAYASLTSAARTDNLRYREFFFNPSNHPDLSYPEMLAGLLDGMRSAEADTGVESRIVVAINREQGAAVALDLVRSVIAHRVDEVVGIGLDHNELVAPPEEFVEAYALARRAGLGLTAHAGERGDTREVWACVESLHVDRIDHGYAAAADPALLSRLRSDGTHVASCWTTCLLHTHGHPENSQIPALLDAGLSVSINSDDPPMFGTSIGREYRLAGQAQGWSRNEARKIAEQAIDGAFADQTSKARMREWFLNGDHASPPRPLT